MVEIRAEAGRKDRRLLQYSRQTTYEDLSLVTLVEMVGNNCILDMYRWIR
jgi:hypothetical protein